MGIGLVRYKVQDRLGTIPSCILLILAFIIVTLMNFVGSLNGSHWQEGYRSEGCDALRSLFACVELAQGLVPRNTQLLTLFPN